MEISRLLPAGAGAAYDGTPLAHHAALILLGGAAGRRFTGRDRLPPAPAGKRTDISRARGSVLRDRTAPPCAAVLPCEAIRVSR